MRVATSSTSFISGSFAEGPHDFEIEADLFHRERDVLIGLNFDLTFEIVLTQIARHLNDFRDRRITADGDCDFRVPSSRTV